MSTAGMVPMISPDGKSGDIPYDHVHDAQQAGFKLATVMTAPNGTTGYIPQERAGDALKAGFKVGAQTLDPNQPGMQPKPSAFYSDLKGMITGAPEGIARMLPGPQQYFQYKDARADYESIKATGKTRAQLADQARQDAGYGLAYRALAPSAENVGVNVQGMEQAAREGDQAAVLGHAAAAATPYVAGAIGGEMLRTPQVSGAMREAQARFNAAKSGGLSETVQNTIGNNPQGKVMDSAANLPPIARSGVEDVFRAAAPTGKNVGFRENVNIAAPDLADIARKTDIAEAKGGIISPDMRVRATSQAIGEHLDEMYNTERKPQIEAHAGVPVEVGTNANAVRGLQYLAKTAGDVSDVALAKKALEEGTLTLSEADRLAQLANKTLVNYERMTPEAQESLRQTNPRIGGLKALDEDFGNNINQVLKENGESGLRSYERRYAALAEIKKQLDSRTNAVELKQPGMLGGIVEPVGKIVGSMIGNPKAGIASASQAAVADVNVGRMLQNGMNKLKNSGLSAKPRASSLNSAVPQ